MKQLELSPQLPCHVARYLQVVEVKKIYPLHQKTPILNMHEYIGSNNNLLQNLLTRSIFYVPRQSTYLPVRIAQSELVVGCKSPFKKSSAG